MSDDEALREVYARIMRQRDAAGRTGAVSVEAMQAVLEHRGPEAERVRTLDAIMRDHETRADFEILRAAYEAAPARPTRNALPYAIAAALVLVVGVEAWLRTRSPVADVARGAPVGAVSVVSPGATAPPSMPIRFTWHRMASATAYALQMTDADGNVAFSRTTADTIVALPDSVRLTPGQTYRWWVEAQRGAEGPSKSAVQSLTIVAR